MKKEEAEALHQLITWLHSFLEIEQAGNVNLDQWVARVQEFRRFLDGQPFLYNYVDDNIWRYLSDIDIRIKEGEAKYRHMQVEQLKSSLRKLAEQISS